MHIRTIDSECFTDYKKPSLRIGTVSCDFKCCKEAGIPITVCQNQQLCSLDVKEVSNEYIIKMYKESPITKAIVIAGFEPFIQFDEIYSFIQAFREVCTDDVVIYTGYYKKEICEEVNVLKQFKNIIVKFGRFKPNQKAHFDSILGVDLANDEQFSEKIS